MRLGGAVLGGQRGGEPGEVHAGLGAEPQLLLRAGGGERGRAAVGDHPAVVDDHHVVGQRLGLLHEVGGEQHGHAVAAQRVDQLPHQAPGLRVEARGGLVEEHQLGAPDDGAGQREPLLLAAGQPLVRGARAAGEPEHVEQPRRVERVRRAGRDQAQHLVRPHARVGAAALGHHADAGAQRVGRARAGRCRAPGPRPRRRRGARCRSRRWWSCPRRWGRAARAPRQPAAPGRARRRRWWGRTV